MRFIRQESSHRRSWSHNLLLQLLQLARQWIDTHICMESTAYRCCLLTLLVPGEGKQMRRWIFLIYFQGGERPVRRTCFHHWPETIRLGLVAVMFSSPDCARFTVTKFVQESKIPTVRDISSGKLGISPTVTPEQVLSGKILAAGVHAVTTCSANREMLSFLSRTSSFLQQELIQGCSHQPL